MSVEPDNTIVEANDSGISSDGVRSAIIDGSIDSSSDVDLYQLQVNAGEGLTLDLDADEFNSGLDPVLRLFDADGQESPCTWRGFFPRSLSYFYCSRYRHLLPWS